MQYRKFGRLGWDISEIGFGAWAVGGGWGTQTDGDSVTALHRALDLGCNFIDTAQTYGQGHSERVIARVLKERKNNERVYVATKIPPDVGMWPPSPYDDVDQRYSEAYLRTRLERSLKDLQTDCIDLVQLHTWTRAFNRNSYAFEVLRRFQREGKLLGIGLSTPEHDQHAVVQPMQDGWIDSVQVIYNIFEQEAQAELFPIAQARNIGVIVRVAFDESSLTGKLKADMHFADGDVRSRFFAGDRIERTLRRVEAIRECVGNEEPDLATAALKFALKPSAVSTVIPGIRNVRQAEMNLAVSGQKQLSDELERKLRNHMWRRGFWYSGK